MILAYTDPPAYYAHGDYPQHPWSAAQHEGT